MDVRIRTITFNVADENPPSDVPAALLGEHTEEELPDIFILAMQEVNLGLQVGALLFWDSWTSAMSEFLLKKGYYRIESIRMQGIVLSVFGKRSLLPQLRDVRCDWIGTGQLGFWGNKGAVAIRLKLFGKTFALINSHLPHGTDTSQYKQRLLSIDKIFNCIKFADLDKSILDHDVVLFQGDLNFRISNVTREEVLQHLDAKEKSQCLKADELNSLLKSHSIISQFSENQIVFNPTYKYDKRSKNYDSSTKKRKPAWTDRILYKSKDIECHNYDEINEVLVSDHRPVFADFSVKVSSKKLPALATVIAKFNPSENEDLKLNVTISQDTFVKNQDWIGIFRPNFKDYRDWVSFQWTAFGKESLKDGRVELELSVSDIIVGGEFVAGYFSSEHQNLIALSEPFHVTSRNPGPTISNAQSNS